MPHQAIKSVSADRVKELYVPVTPGKPQSVPIAGSAQEGRSAIYRNARFEKELLQTLDPKLTTIHDAFEAAANAVPANNCLGHRPYDPATRTYGDYVWEDYQTVQRRRAQFGAGLVQLHREVGITGKQYGVGLWCLNRPEWQITDLGCMSQSLFTVSLYDTLGPDAVEYIINHAELACVVTSLNHITTLLKLKPRLPSLKLIVSLDAIEAGERPGESKKDLLNSLAKEQGVSIYSIKEVETLGLTNSVPFNPPSPDDIITINYTSGTTGNPKGVVLTHRNAVAGACSAIVGTGTNTNDVSLSFLPLAHIYQRVTEHAVFWMGASTGYFKGDVVTLVEDIKLLRPTLFNAVPRLWNRFGAAARGATEDAPGVKGMLSRHIIGVKTANIEDPDPARATNKHAIYDRIWSKKVAAAFGLDRARSMVSGASPIDPGLHTFLRIIFPNSFVEGYGMTENYASALIQGLGDMTAGHCGAVVPTAEICLRDVPDMEYLSTDQPHPRGELLIRGNCNFKEYFRDPAETAKAVDADGWLHTGDIAQVDELGRFKIVDRVKNLLKLAQGEYISPERIEQILLASCPFLASAYVHGDATQSSLVGLFGVAPDAFAPWASAVLGTTVPPTDFKAVAQAAAHPKVRDAARKELERAAKKNKFNSYERVRACFLALEPFTVENELMTPTFKLKRPKVAKHYRDVLDQLYAEVAQQDAGKAVAKL